MLITMDTQRAANHLASDLGPFCVEFLGHECQLEDDHHEAVNNFESANSEKTKSTLDDRLRQVRFPRTMSQDRRINETVQFYEALGECDAKRESLDIVDTEESFDEDESAFEIQEVRIPAHTHPSKASSLNEYLRLPRFKTFFSFSFQHTAPASGDMDYEGIDAHGLEITKRGVQRGNYSTLHRKAWLEVSDPKHRYGKNLRLYYRRRWGSLGYPTNNFFDWLDSKGDAEDESLPDLPECPRINLDIDTVLYVNDSEGTRSYMLSIVSSTDRRSQILDIDGEPICTGADSWIFVLRDNALYGSRKITAVSRHSKQRFHHSSFFGGKAVAAAGIVVTDHDGIFLTPILTRATTVQANLICREFYVIFTLRV
jgi:hypothetical protein